MSNNKPVIVISATRFFQGGTLVIVNECLKFLSRTYQGIYHIKALVHDKTLFDPIEGIEWVEFPKSRKSVFHRLYDEYIYFSKCSIKWRPVLWLSLQDSTPRVKARVRAVYFHNPLLLSPKHLKLWKYQPRLSVLRLFYKNIYTRGIQKNDVVITQQETIARFLSKTYQLPLTKLWVFPPVIKAVPSNTSLTEVPDSVMEESLPLQNEEDELYTFIYPATAFYYKNHEVIIKACKRLQNEGVRFRIWLTIDGTENNYIRKLVTDAKKSLSQVKFLGFLKRGELFEYYKKADCLVFPSLLESWGLPLSEFATFNKPILCADLPYGRSTLQAQRYNKAVYFDPSNDQLLAEQMRAAIKGALQYSENNSNTPGGFKQVDSWEQCFNLLLALR